ncbi:curli production assembly/transport protein CsgE, partial [Klebsiella pneumoniae subsp. pneumoniae]
SAQIREILISESAWEEMTCLFAPSLKTRLKNLISNFNYRSNPGDFCNQIKGNHD